jgi:hypothetical protein
MAVNEYGHNPRGMSGAYGSVKLRNAIKRIDPALQVELRNVRVNGQAMGCTGFITNVNTGAIVYVDTDHNHGMSYDNALYRTARHNRDYSGGVNRFSDYAGLAAAVVALVNASAEHGAIVSIPTVESD